MAWGKLSPEQQAQLPPPADTKVDFKRDIQPIFEESCINCHGRGKSKGGFVLDTREMFLKGGDTGPAAIPGKSGESLVIEMVSGLDPDIIMPRPISWRVATIEPSGEELSVVTCRCRQPNAPTRINHENRRRPSFRKLASAHTK